MRALPLFYLVALLVLAIWPEPSWKYPLFVPAVGASVWLYTLSRLRSHQDEMAGVLAGLVASAGLAALTIASWLHLGLVSTLLLVALVVLVQPIAFVVILSRIDFRGD